MKILLVDQFFTVVTPYSLSQEPMTFEALTQRIITAWEANVARLKELYGPNVYIARAPEVLEVDSGWCQPFATTAFREGANGMAEVHGYRWDTSG